MKELLFKKLVRDRKILTPEQIEECHQAQEEGSELSLWEIATEKGWLTEEKSESLLKEVRLFLENPDAEVSRKVKGEEEKEKELESSSPEDSKKDSKEGKSSEKSPSQGAKEKREKKEKKGSGKLSVEEVKCPECEEEISLPPAVLAKGKPIQCPFCPNVIRLDEGRGETSIYQVEDVHPQETKKEEDPSQEGEKEVSKREENPSQSSSPSQSKSASALRLPIENIPKGTNLGRYVIVHRKKAQKSSVTYEAQQISMKRKVIIKIFPPHVLDQEGELLKDFVRSLSAWGSLQSSYVVRLFDFSQIAGAHFFVLPHLEGESLESLFQRKRFARSDSHQLMIELAQAVDALHQKGVIHFNLKPSNFFLTPEDNLLVTDLSIPEISRMEKTSYVPPELYSNSPPSFFSTDIYSLGMIYKRLLSRTEVGEIGPYRALLDKMTDSDPKARPKRIQEVLTALRKVSEIPSSSTSEEEVKKGKKEGEETAEDALFAVIFTVMIFTAIAMVIFLLLQLID